MRSRVPAKVWIPVIFAAAVLVRVIHLDLPFLEPFNNYSRQSMCASVARNFYTRGFNLFYPEIDENGSGPSLYNVEMPLGSYLMAWAYKMAGGVKEGAARAVSVGFSIGFLCFLYLLVRRAASAPVARWALGFAAFSPMAVALSRSIQPDIAMLCLGTGSLYGFWLYSEKKKNWSYVLSALSLLLAVLIRPFALYFLIPILFLAFRTEGWRFLRRPRHYVYLCGVGLALLWYVRMWLMGRELQLAYEPYQYSSATARLTFMDFVSRQYLALPAKAVLLHLLTPLGAVVCGLGLTGGLKQKGLGFFGIWLAGTLLYLAVIWRTAVVHPYYFLPLAAPLSYFFGLGMERIRLGPGYLWKGLRHPWVLGLVAALEVANLGYYYRLLYFVPRDRMAVVEAGSAVNRLIPADALVIAAYHTSPIQLYYCHRRGWTLSLEDSEGDQVARIEALRLKGAAYFVTTELDALKERVTLSAYLAAFPVESRTDRYVIYRIGEAGQ